MNQQRNNCNHIYMIICLAIVGVSMFWCSQKSGMFLDEIYSYGLSNGYYTPFIREVPGNNDLSEYVMDRDEMLSYLSVDETDRFEYGSVYYNQSRDVHPPLYYWLLHTVCSFFPNTFTKWTGLGLNLAVFAATLYCLYRLTEKLFDDQEIAIFAVILYGLSAWGLATMLMIRMYMLMSLLTVLLAHIIFRLTQEDKWYLYAALFSVIFLGLLTQYYFVIYTFFACLAFLLFTIWKKQWKKILLLSSFALAGVLVMVVVFPAALEHIFISSKTTVSGRAAVTNLLNFEKHIDKIRTYIEFGKNGAWLMEKVSIIAIVAVLVRGKKHLSQMHEVLGIRQAIFLVLPACCTYIFIAMIAPYKSDRYIYNLVPILTLIPCMLLYLVKQVYHLRSAMVRLCILLLPVAVVVSLNIEPKYVYKHYIKFDNLISAHADSPCVYYLGKNEENPPITQDLGQLMQFENVLFIYDASAERIAEYVEDEEEVVFFASKRGNVDIAGTIEKISMNLQYDSVEKIWNGTYSESYILSRKE